jgi:hypothetical protein
VQRFASIPRPTQPLLTAPVCPSFRTTFGQRRDRVVSADRLSPISAQASCSTLTIRVLSGRSEAGRLLDALDAAGRARDTVLVFLSDNGMSVPFAKATLYRDVRTSRVWGPSDSRRESPISEGPRALGPYRLRPMTTGDDGSALLLAGLVGNTLATGLDRGSSCSRRLREKRTYRTEQFERMWSSRPYRDRTCDPLIESPGSRFLADATGRLLPVESHIGRVAGDQ